MSGERTTHQLSGSLLAMRGVGNHLTLWVKAGACDPDDEWGKKLSLGRLWVHMLDLINQFNFKSNQIKSNQINGIV
jgi:hypothetical protein